MKSVLVIIGLLILSVLITKYLGSKNSATTNVLPNNADKETQKDTSDTSGQSKINKSEKGKRYPKAIEFVNPSGYLNTPKISVSELIGKKVILLDFWTYSCINCQRTQPYLNSWYEKYKDEGLEIIGIHTPEFEFEKNRDNLLSAMKKAGIKYPVVQDNDYETWGAYGNRYWPRKYLVDIDGYVVYDHIGEGAYEETEKKIQELLEERMNVLSLGGKINKDMSEPVGTLGIGTTQINSPETYFGYLRNELLANGQMFEPGVQKFVESKNIEVNKLYLVGNWNFEKEFAENKSDGAKIIYKYNAREVYLVTSSPTGVKLSVYQDGKPIASNIAGDDIIKQEEGARVLIKEDRLYKLIKNDKAGEHILEIIVENPGLKAFAFTFG